MIASKIIYLYMFVSNIELDDQKKKKIDPLTQIDLSKIKFEDFNKTFYVEN